MLCGCLPVRRLFRRRARHRVLPVRIHSGAKGLSLLRRAAAKGEAAGAIAMCTMEHRAGVGQVVGLGRTCHLSVNSHPKTVDETPPPGRPSPPGPWCSPLPGPRSILSLVTRLAP